MPISNTVKVSRRRRTLLPRADYEIAINSSRREAKEINEATVRLLRAKNYVFACQTKSLAVIILTFI